MSLHSTRVSLIHAMTEALRSSSPSLLCILNECLSGDQTTTTQFFLDCSTLPSVIREVQCHGDEILETLLKHTRNFCYRLHRERMNQLDDEKSDIFYSHI